MIDTKTRFHVHIIEIKSGKHLLRPIMRSVPRVGDELRISDKNYWKVNSVIWCLDEDDSPYTRINLGVEKITND